MADAPELPPPLATLHALGHLASVLEKELPGILDVWVASMENEASAREVVRLRGPKETPEIKEARLAAIVWADRVRLLALAHIARRKRRRA